MKTARILIVGGEPETAELCGIILDKENKKYVSLAVDWKNSDRVVRVAEAFKPDIVLVLAISCLMPLDGLEVCRRLRKSVEVGHAKIILSSCKHSESVLDEVRDCGADVFLQKPFYPEELCKLVEKLLI